MPDYIIPVLNPDGTFQSREVNEAIGTTVDAKIGDPGFQEAVRGPQGVEGPDGPRGLPGLDAMPQAEGMAEHISTPGPVQTALIQQTVETARHGITTADEKKVFVTPRGSDGNDGLTLKTAKRTIDGAVAALSGSRGLVQLSAGTVTQAATADLTDGVAVRGAGAGVSFIQYTGTVTPFTSSTPGTRTYRHVLSDLAIVGPGKTTDTIGLDLASISEASVSNVVISGFGVGVNITSPINGGAVYNRFYNVKVLSCTTGWFIGPSGSNGNTFIGSRAGGCDIGVHILDANNNTFLACQIEANVLGVKIEATSNSMADLNAFVSCRWENNETAWETTPLTRYTQITDPKTFGTYAYIDNGQATTHTGAMGSQQNFQQSGASEPGGSWRFTRNANGGSENPAFLVRDANTAAGTPVTFQAETERSTGYPFRAKRNGQTVWDVDALGNMRTLGGGYVELSPRANHPVAPASGARFYARPNASGKTTFYVRFPTGDAITLATEV